MSRRYARDSVRGRRRAQECLGGRGDQALNGGRRGSAHAGESCRRRPREGTGMHPYVDSPRRENRKSDNGLRRHTVSGESVIESGSHNASARTRSESNPRPVCIKRRCHSVGGIAGVSHSPFSASPRQLGIRTAASGLSCLQRECEQRVEESVGGGGMHSAIGKDVRIEGGCDAGGRGASVGVSAGCAQQQKGVCQGRQGHSSTCSALGSPQWERLEEVPSFCGPGALLQHDLPEENRHGGCAAASAEAGGHGGSRCEKGASASGRQSASQPVQQKMETVLTAPVSPPANNLLSTYFLLIS
eukprot:TRINITY_DN12519_c0_g1_i1.p2 TRINITY_DN12519_c0_g1~~TRINITY_DN12519_c0_g1_i1.p2  ORF type:complete len:301 (+),score=2.79 TRINITY_DN12519_c0_g1_i1:1586-2488(+)